MAYRMVRALVWSALMLGLGLGACTGDERSKPLNDDGINLPGRGGSSGLGNSGSGGSESVDAGLDAAAAANCGDFVCRGGGRCGIVGGQPTCICDEGYLLQGDECVVNQECIRLRLLERGCRQRHEAEPAVAIFFGLETCAGTSVRPEILGDVSQAFKVLENGRDLGDESYAALLERDVESFVTIAIDLSGSLQREQATLVALIGRLKDMVQSLEPAAGGPPVSISLIVFGRSVHTVQEFTTDFAQASATLDAIQADPLGAITEPGGTNVYGAVNQGISELNEALLQRYAQTLGSVVTTGTLVTITDGRDSAGVQLSDIDETTLNLISVGISSNIDDQELTTIGPQGSFLAPSQADWVQAFQQISERVSEYPKRSYLVAYCSPAVEGAQEVTITLAARPTDADAKCTFDAADFGVGAGACDATFIGNYCSAQLCGSFLACGACDFGDAGVPAEQYPEDAWQFTD